MNPNLNDEERAFAGFFWAVVIAVIFLLVGRCTDHRLDDADRRIDALETQVAQR